MKEQFSFAYVRAVCSAAGVAASVSTIDDDSVDMTLSMKSVEAEARHRSPKLDIQVKCTSRDVIKGDVIKFPLPRKNYDELIPRNLHAPRILIVVIVPEESDDWVSQSEQELVMRRCGYWISLRGRPETTNTTTVTIDIPRARMFTVGALEGIMKEIERGVFQ